MSTTTTKRLFLYFNETMIDLLNHTVTSTPDLKITSTLSDNTIYEYSLNNNTVDLTPDTKDTDNLVLENHVRLVEDLLYNVVWVMKYGDSEIYDASRYTKPSNHVLFITKNILPQNDTYLCIFTYPLKYPNMSMPVKQLAYCTHKPSIKKLCQGHHYLHNTTKDYFRYKGINNTSPREDGLCLLEIPNLQGFKHEVCVNPKGCPRCNISYPDGESCPGCKDHDGEFNSILLVRYYLGVLNYYLPKEVKDFKQFSSELHLCLVSGYNTYYIEYTKNNNLVNPDPE
jgi:hypothetical protein